MRARLIDFLIRAFLQPYRRGWRDLKNLSRIDRARGVIEMRHIIRRLLIDHLYGTDPTGGQPTQGGSPPDRSAGFYRDEQHQGYDRGYDEKTKIQTLITRS